MKKNLYAAIFLALITLMIGFSMSTRYYLGSSALTSATTKVENYESAFIAAFQNQPDALQKLNETTTASSDAKYLTLFHAHTLNFCIFLILFCFCMEYFQFRRDFELVICIALVLGMVCYVVGLLLHAKHHTNWGQWLNVIGAGAIISTPFTLLLFGLFGKKYLGFLLRPPTDP